MEGNGENEKGFILIGAEQGRERERSEKRFGNFGRAERVWRPKRSGALIVVCICASVHGCKNA